ncbi:lysine exporter LysO family protein [Halotalea alkalilenta]|uniref:Lysine exporter LysO family protein n=1 Tax=Halotalea alkalilenta TaxID=376489 RepID=A0A172YDD8_9GAMM|nr:lysine exporter LysO family protein [Halotalea alkalilenta]ANF57112.1 hypothetical protein A5892_06235 [Halotalea alkalilenta]
MSAGLLLMLLPLLLGYLLPPRGPRFEHAVGRLLELIVYLILALMGASLAGLDDLGRQLGRIGLQAATLFVILAVCNLAALWLLVGRRGTSEQDASAFVPTSGLAASLGSSVMLLVAVAAGTVAGLLLPLLADHAGSAAEAALYLLLGLIGHQLRHADISLKRVLLNTLGVRIAIALVFSSLVAGAIAAPLLGLPVHQGMALASGFGWYSLSGILISDQLGAFYGGIAFFNDLARELLAVLLLPLLIRHTPGTAIGYCGATAMDVTLPLIRRAGGLSCVPVALVSGFLLSALAPPLMLTLLAFTV